MGRANVDEMLAGISSRQLTEWMAYGMLEPFGPLAERYGHAMTTAMIANTHRKQDVEPFMPDDFMPGGGERREQPMTTNVFGTLKALFGAKKRGTHDG